MGHKTEHEVDYMGQIKTPLHSPFMNTYKNQHLTRIHPLRVHASLLYMI